MPIACRNLGRALLGFVSGDTDDMAHAYSVRTTRVSVMQVDESVPSTSWLERRNLQTRSWSRSASARDGHPYDRSTRLIGLMLVVRRALIDPNSRISPP